MAYSKVFLLAALCLGVAVAAPQSLVRLVPADLGLGSGLRAVPADTIESHAVHTVHQDTPVITRLVQTGDGFTHLEPAETRFVQAGPLVTRLVPAAPAITRVVPAAPAVTTVVQAAPVVKTVVEAVQAEVTDPNPQYNFGYSVADTITGDSKTREEQRDGDVVTGSYTVADPDGRIRRVTYTADSVNGFQAKVTYDGEEGPVAIPVEAGVQTQSVSVAATPAASVVANNDDNDSDTVIEVIRKNPSAAPALIRAVPQPIGTATLVSNLGGLQRFATLQPQPQLIQIDGSADQATLVRNLDGTHALHRVAAAQQPQLVQIEGSDQTFEVTPFGLRSLPLGSRFAQNGPFVLRSAPNAQFIQA